jgi:hypothetical protein
MKKIALLASSLVLLATFISMLAQNPSMQQKVADEVKELQSLSIQIKALNNTTEQVQSQADIALSDVKIASVEF